MLLPAERRGRGPARPRLTWEKYSSEMRAAHSMLCSSGRQGLDTSAHLISMRLMRVRFSGVLSILFMAACSLSVSYSTRGIQAIARGPLVPGPVALRGPTANTVRRCRISPSGAPETMLRRLSIELGPSRDKGAKQGRAVAAAEGSPELEVSAPPFSLARSSHSKPFSQLPFLSVLSLSFSLGKNSKTDFNFYLNRV